ncbi:MAG: MBL fold metallo-hydrolase [Clostridia bacterium]|nr:MBL fold metallo-hydrolase [Clostridia bacterium]
MKLKVLGTQSPYNTEGHNSPGFFIEEGDHRIMLDCGSGSHSLLNYPDDLKNLSVIITHLHRDHYNDLFNLQYASFVFANQKRLKKPVNVYLPLNPKRILVDIVSEENSFTNIYSINEKSYLVCGNLVVTFCKMKHPVETYAVKITNGVSKIVYSSDTSFAARSELVEFARGADVFICESSLLESHGFPEINSHLTAKQAATIAKEAKVNTLMLTHFWPEESPENYVEEAKMVFENVIAAEEGALFVV